MFVVIFLWLTLILVGMKYNKDAADTAYMMEKSIALRGICSVEI